MQLIILCQSILSLNVSSRHPVKHAIRLYLVLILLCKFSLGWWLDRCPPCQVSLQKLIERKQEQYSSCARTRLAARETMWETPIPPPGWSLGGNLVAHLHEHRGAITRYLNFQRWSFFIWSISWIVLLDNKFGILSSPQIGDSPGNVFFCKCFCWWMH